MSIIKRPGRKTFIIVALMSNCDGLLAYRNREHIRSMLVEVKTPSDPGSP